MKELFETVVGVLTNYFESKPLFDQDETDEWRIWEIGAHTILVNRFRGDGRVTINISHHGTVRGAANDLFEQQVLAGLRGQMGSAELDKIRVISLVREHQIA